MKSRRNKLILTLALLTCSISLAGCEPKQTPPIAAVQSQAIRSVGDAAAASQRRAEIIRQIRAICPTPTQWTPAQMRAVADFIERNAGQAGSDLLAREWGRLNAGANLCRDGNVSA